MMIMNFESLKWFLEDMRDGRDYPRRPPLKKPKKRGATYVRPRNIKVKEPAKERDYASYTRMRLGWHKRNMEAIEAERKAKEDE